MPIHRIKNSVDKEFFYHDPAQKKNQIAVMPRRGSLELRETLNGLMYRNKLNGWEIKLIDKLNEAQVARVLRESKIFLPTGYLEGLPLPVMEAMACGCVLIGYHGQGARELFVNNGTVNVEVGNVRQFINCIEEILEDSDEFLPGMGETNAKFMLENYSADDEKKSIIDAWDEILTGNTTKGE
jgi:glycosyltransferase involved in cell wall biosynthesis